MTPDRRFRARVDDAIREGLKRWAITSRPLNLISVHRQRKGAGIDRQSHARRAGVNWRHRLVLRGGARTDKDYLKLLDTRRLLARY